MKTGILPYIPTGFCLICISLGLHASPVKISFLDNEAALKQTIGFLASKGCHADSIHRFRQVVQWNNESPLGSDIKAFPNNEQGYYSFPAITNPIAALPQPLIAAAHPYQLDCFDNVILLAGNLMQTTQRADDLSGPIIVPIPITNHVVQSIAAETSRDAYNLTYPAWYREASKVAATAHQPANQRFNLFR